MASRLKQILSIIISFAIYSYVFNWKTSLLLIIGISWHEQGHLLAAQMLNLKTNKFYLIPFFGGISLINEPYKTYVHLALVALAGPLAGLLSALICLSIWFITGSFQFLIITYWLSLFNLFNLLPLAMLDGGQILESISYSVGISTGTFITCVSTVVAVPILWFFSPVIACLIGFFGLFKIINEVNKWRTFQNLKKYKLSYDDARMMLSYPEPMKLKTLLLTLGAYLLTASLLTLLVLLTSKFGIDIKHMFTQ